MNLEERLEKTMLAITFAEEGKHEWARKLLSELDKQRLRRTKKVLRDRLTAIELYLESLSDRKVKIERQKFFNTKHYLIFIKNLTGLVRHHLIFTYEFVSENTTVEIVEKLMSWNLADLLAKAGKHLVLVSDQGLHVPSLSGLHQ